MPQVISRFVLSITMLSTPSLYAEIEMEIHRVLTEKFSWEATRARAALLGV
jgi:hypothetical protein